MTTRPSSVIEKKKVTFPDLDIVKLLMAVLVVEIHTRPFGATSLVQGVDCVAVPFFFISSAFLCFRGLNTAQFSNSKSSACTRVRNTTKRLLQLYLIWTLIYIPVSLFGYINSGLTPLKTLLYFIRGTILVGENIYIHGRFGTCSPASSPSSLYFFCFDGDCILSTFLVLQRRLPSLDSRFRLFMNGRLRQLSCRGSLIFIS